MNISNVGSISSQYPVGADDVQKPEQDGTSDIEQQIKTLDKEKGKLEGQRDKERNPFALQQSTKYKDLEKRIKEVDKQIQQLKSEASSVQKKADNGKQEASSSRNQFDTYIPEQQEFKD
ncbi:MAG: hypothetical protein K0R23_2224 [Lacrimispora sp.]|jgi:chromosome segregation ATPase|nr:hypothetical protein [Lacrimispora sp.]